MTTLSENLANHVAVHIREPTIDSVVSEREPFVIQTKQVQNGCVQIVDRQLVLHGFDAQFIGRAVTDTRPDASTSQKRCETVWIVISAFGALLKNRHSAELCAPDN